MGKTAFSLVSRVLLLQKLNMLGFDACLIDCVQEFLRGRFISASMATISSVEVAVTSIVPKVSVLEPLLFLIYVNYVTKDITGPWAAYADDFKLSLCYPRGQATK